MPNEFDISASIVYADSEGTEITAAVENVLRSITTKLVIHHKQSIGTTEEALDLGGLTAPLGWFFGINWDTSNYLEVRSGTGASNDIVRVDPLCPCLFRWGSDVTAPYAIANTAAVQFEYWIWAP